MRLVLIATAAVAVASTSVLGHIGHGVAPGQHYNRREDATKASAQLGRIRRQATPTDAASRAQITSESVACQSYYVPEVAALASQFPTPYQIADVLPNDAEAQAVWKSIQDSGIIPAGINQKGTHNGDFSNTTPYYPASDPDCWWTYSPGSCRTPKHEPNRIPEDIFQCPTPSTWGLTVDDGPNCASGTHLLPFLRQHNIKMSAYFIGSNVMAWPIEAQLHFLDGHHIAVHTWSHNYMTSLTNSQIFAELYYTAKAIKQIVGVTPRAWRPPYGDVDDRVRAIATGLGLETHIWTDDTDDWTLPPLGTANPASVVGNYQSIINEANDESGNIVLTHETSSGTMNMLTQMLPQIQARYKHIAPLTACLNDTRPYAEDITYPDFAAYISGDTMPKGLPNAQSIKIATDANDYSPATGSATASSTSSSAAPSTTSAVKESALTSIAPQTGRPTSTGRILPGLNGGATRTSSGATGPLVLSLVAVAVGASFALLA